MPHSPTAINRAINYPDWYNPPPENQYTITGTGFGTKSGTPSFDDFESEALGQTGGTVGSFIVENPGVDTTIVNTDSHSGSKSLSHSFAGQWFPRIYKALTSSNQRAYLACYVKFSGGVVSNAVWKTTRLGSGATYTGVPKASGEYTSAGGSPVPQSVSGSVTNGDGVFTAISSDNLATANPATTITQGVWHFYEIEFYSGTVGGNDAYFRESWDGVDVIRYENMNYLTAGNQVLPSWMFLPFTGIDQTTSITEWVDDVYIDESRARVVMTNNSVYALSTEFAIQPIVTFTDTEVTPLKRRQTFSIGATAWLHLIIDDGTPAAIKQVTVEADD